MSEIIADDTGKITGYFIRILRFIVAKKYMEKGNINGEKNLTLPMGFFK